MFTDKVSIHATRLNISAHRFSKVQLIELQTVLPYAASIDVEAHLLLFNAEIDSAARIEKFKHSLCTLIKTYDKYAGHSSRIDLKIPITKLNKTLGGLYLTHSPTEQVRTNVSN